MAASSYHDASMTKLRAARARLSWVWRIFLRRARPDTFANWGCCILWTCRSQHLFWVCQFWLRLCLAPLHFAPAAHSWFYQKEADLCNHLYYTFFLDPNRDNAPLILIIPDAHYDVDRLNLLSLEQTCQRIGNTDKLFCSRRILFSKFVCVRLHVKFSEFDLLRQLLELLLPLPLRLLLNLVKLESKMHPWTVFCHERTLPQLSFSSSWGHILLLPKACKRNSKYQPVDHILDFAKWLPADGTIEWTQRGREASFCISMRLHHRRRYFTSYGQVRNRKVLPGTRRWREHSLAWDLCEAHLRYGWTWGWARCCILVWLLAPRSSRPTFDWKVCWGHAPHNLSQGRPRWASSGLPRHHQKWKHQAAWA